VSRSLANYSYDGLYLNFHCMHVHTCWWACLKFSFEQILRGNQRRAELDQDGVQRGGAWGGCGCEQRARAASPGGLRRQKSW